MNEPPLEPLETLGLWGDGDELQALRDVEKRFGVKLDYRGAGEWRTVGDVFAALLEVLPGSREKSPETWNVFAEAIAQETGADSHKITPETRLIDRKGSPLLSVLVLLVGALTIGAIVLWG
jgi:hypothetical protein